MLFFLKKKKSARSQAKERILYLIPFVQLSREHKLMNSDKEKISGFLEMGGIIGRKAKKAHRNFWKWWIRSWS